MPLLGRSALTGVIEEHMEAGYTLDELTVLARDNDPFRQDRDEGHKLGRWLRDTLQDKLHFEVGEGGRVIHNRGLHYLLIGQRKPDGRVYENDERTWKWLSNRVSKAARWLGYVPFEQITDQRNAEPVVRILPAQAEEQILVYDSGDLDLDAVNFAPWAHLEGGGGIQPYRLAIIGEKSSLEPVLGPVAEEYGADLYLPTGEISDTILHRMAARTAAEQRPLICFYFADCDPSGWQMGISVSRKLQALSELLGGFEFEVHRVALVPGQVRELGLPSTPLKATEKRAARWERPWARSRPRSTRPSRCARMTWPASPGRRSARSSTRPCRAASRVPGRTGRTRPSRTSTPGWTATVMISCPLPGTSSARPGPWSMRSASPCRPAQGRMTCRPSSRRSRLCQPGMPCPAGLARPWSAAPGASLTSAVP